MVFLSFQRATCKMPVECLPYWSYLLDFFVVGVEKVKLYEDQIMASNGYAAISYTADLLMANLHISQPGASSVQILKQGSLLQLHWTLCRQHSQLPKSSISAARSSEGLRRQLHPC
jgi:hypothetical protein